MQTECKKLLKSKKKTFSNAAHIFDAGGDEKQVFFFLSGHGETIVSGGPDERSGGKTVGPKIESGIAVGPLCAVKGESPPLLLWSLAKQQVLV